MFCASIIDIKEVCAVFLNQPHRAEYQISGAETQNDTTNASSLSPTLPAFDLRKHLRKILKSWGRNPRYFHKHGREVQKESPISLAHRFLYSHRSVYKAIYPSPLPLPLRTLLIHSLSRAFLPSSVLSHFQFRCKFRL